jgi:hypothetical protein
VTPDGQYIAGRAVESLEEAYRENRERLASSAPISQESSSDPTSLEKGGA